jgi:hypothetical protein
MPLQNRVDPFGQIHAVPERGMFTGNRGIIHDPETKTLLRKRWALPAWIICVCEYRGKRREPMGRNRPGGPNGIGLPGWTELFFLDEVTGLAAGHRPCFFCRRKEAEDFVRRFGEAFDIAEPRAPMVDKRLHKERLAAGAEPRLISVAELEALPDGAMVADAATAYAIRNGRLLRWSFAGYQRPQAIGAVAREATSLQLVTPPTTVSVLRRGFRPAWHPSAG